MVPLDELVAVRHRAQEAERKLQAVEAEAQKRAEAEMTELERLKAENQRLAQSVTGYEIETRKQKALTKAKSKLGEGFTLEGVEAQVDKAISRLSYDEKTIDEDVMTIIDMAKKPKTQARSPLLGTAPAASNGSADPLTLTGRELGQLARDNPDEFKRVVEARRSSMDAQRAAERRGIAIPVTPTKLTR